MTNHNARWYPNPIRMKQIDGPNFDWSISLPDRALSRDLPIRLFRARSLLKRLFRFFDAWWKKSVRVLKKIFDKFVIKNFESSNIFPAENYANKAHNMDKQKQRKEVLNKLLHKACNDGNFEGITPLFQSRKNLSCPWILFLRMIFRC